MATRANAISANVPPYVGALPETAMARGGCVFWPRRDLWELKEGTQKVALHFDELPDLEPSFKTAFKVVLLWYAENHSIRHVGNLFYRSKALFQFKLDGSPEPVYEISDIDILNYKSVIGAARQWYLGSLSGFLRRWAELGLGGITKEAVALFKQMRLQGNAKGVATATMDPEKGPLTAIEMEAVQAALNDAYGRGEVELADYVLCWLLMALGQRATQYAALKVCDLSSYPSSDGLQTYMLRMPRAKGRESNPRGEFRDRILNMDLGALVATYKEQVRTRFALLLKDPNDAPLFPGDLVNGAISGYEYHQTSLQIKGRITSTLQKLLVSSERTGNLIHIGVKRFRDTLGTRAAEEGYGELVIAELLDHSDTQNVGVYVRATPAIVERIDRALAMHMAPMAQAFAGKLIDGPQEASRADDPNSRIRAPAITGNFEPISSCGKHGFCGFLKPIACYTCRSFEPWLDGPHEQVLEHLLAERDRLLKADKRLACINDRTILAVAEVIQRCGAEHAAIQQTRG